MEEKVQINAETKSIYFEGGIAPYGESTRRQVIIERVTCSLGAKTLSSRAPEMVFKLGSHAPHNDFFPGHILALDFKVKT